MIAIPEESLRGPTTFRLKPYEETDHDGFGRPDRAHHEALRCLREADEPSSTSPVSPHRQELAAARLAREKLVKIGARIVRHGRYVVFQLAEVAVPRSLFADILRRIDDLRPKPPPLPA